MLFLAGPNGKFPCSATSDGYTGGNYQPVAGIGWIDCADPPGDPQPVCAVGGFLHLYRARHTRQHCGA